MTPDERAEKIFKDFQGNEWMDLYNDDRPKFVARIAAEIRAAVEEGIANTLGPNVVHSQEWLAQELARAKAEAVEEVGVVCDRQGAIPYSFTTDEVKRFKAEAYEDAAKIAEDLECDQDTGAPLTRIAEAIRARAAEVGK